MATPWRRTGPGRNGTVVATASRPADAVALGPERGLRAVADAELPEDPRQVRFDRLLADLQAPCDQLVRQTRGQKLQVVGLAVRDGGERVGCRTRIQLVPRAPRDERRLAARRSADAGHHVLRRRVLEQ